MRGLFVSVVRFFWRQIFLPVIGLLPTFRQGQLRTIAHHAKMTLVHGQVLEFGRPVDRDVEIPPAIQVTDPIAKTPAVDVPSLIPIWIVNELHSLAAIEPNLFPRPDLLGQYVSYVPSMETEPGEVYAACCSVIGKLRPDIIFLIPWLVRGGADKGVLYYVQAALLAGKNVLLISTLERESTWKYRLPEQAVLLELGKEGRNLSERQRLSVLTRLVLQSNAEIIHNVNSGLGWEMVKQYGRTLIAQNKRIFASVFCDDYDIHGALHSYPQMYLIDCWRFLDGLICDSLWFPQDLKRQYGVNTEKIFTAYFPVDVVGKVDYRGNSVHKVLWAGRISKQKRIDLLIEVAELMPDVGFDVYGYASNSYELEMLERLRSLPNVNFGSSYDDLNSVIENNTYGLLLYTSGWDGLPNVPLEATISGLPIVASAVCGIPELINEETGYPVWSVDDSQAYVDRIREAFSDDGARENKWASAVELVLSRHTIESFSKQLNGIPGYFTEKQG